MSEGEIFMSDNELDNGKSPVHAENKMGVMPVKPLIISMALPMMLSMIVQALYNIVDSIFVARLSESAVTAVTLVFPLQNLMISLGLGTGVGINALLSQSLGAKKFSASDAAANTGILLNFIHFIIFLCIGFFCSAMFINSQTSDPEIAGYAVSYMKVVSVLSFGCFFQLTFERLLQSTGRTSLSMISQMSGAVINIILDPIMIFGLCGFPRLEVAGAALATCIGQMCAAVIGLVLNIKYNKDISLSLKKILSPKAETVRAIYMVGVPSMLMMAIGSVMTYFMNLITGKFSSTAQAVFGIYFRLQSFVFMPVFGLNNGLIPVMAYNYGAKDKKRIMEALKFSLTLAIVIMCFGSLIMILFPGRLLGIFKASDYMLKIGVPAMRTIAVHFPMAAVGIVLGSVFQAFSKSMYSLVISLARQLVVLIPVAWLLSLTGVLNYIWWCYPIAEVIAVLLTIVFFNNVKKSILDPLEKAPV